MENAKNLNLGNFPNIYNISENLKARNSLITQCETSAKKYLRNNFNIIIEDNNESNSFNKTINPPENNKNFLYTSYNANRFFTQRKKYPFKFVNDANSNCKKNFSTPKTEIKNENDKSENPLFKIDNHALKKMTFLKGAMVKDAKDLDTNKRGSITKEKAIIMLMKNIPELQYDLALKKKDFSISLNIYLRILI